jgi:hypothetical protein
VKISVSAPIVPAWPSQLADLASIAHQVTAVEGMLRDEVQLHVDAEVPTVDF